MDRGRSALWVLILAGHGCALPDPDGKNLCETSKDCLDGKACVGGVCGGEPGDGDNGDGDVHEFIGCPAAQCPDNQRCQQGVCVEEFSISPACDPETFGGNNDGCPSDALCFGDVGSAACRRYPPCPEGGCPTGTHGAVCNTGQLPTKGSICLAGFCSDAFDCPNQWGCVRYFATDPIGVCSSGAPGTACSDDNHCTSGSCSTFVAVCN